MELKEIVLKTLKKSDKPLKGGEIAQLSGLEKDLVDKTIKLLKNDGLIDSPKRCFYTAK